MNDDIKHQNITCLNITKTLTILSQQIILTRLVWSTYIESRAP